MNGSKTTRVVGAGIGGLNATIAVIALLTVAGIVATSIIAPWKKQPGRLVATVDYLTWRGPSGKPMSEPLTEPTTAKFELRNRGGTTVRILQMTSSCGCASPKANPSIIEPGATSIVEVQAVPLAMGERLATVTLKTDSPITPEISLRLNIIGNREPPFMGRAVGDLSFNNATVSDTRKIQVVTVERVGAVALPPVARSDLPFLNIGAATMIEEAPYTTPDSIYRRYTFDVGIASAVPGESFAGDVVVIDPWDTRHTERVRVIGEIDPPLKAIPARLLITADKGRLATNTPARFLVRSQSPVEGWIADVESEAKQAPIIVAFDSTTQDRRTATITVSLKPGKFVEGEYKVVVKRTDSGEQVFVPVSIRSENLR